MPRYYSDILINGTLYLIIKLIGHLLRNKLIYYDSIKRRQIIPEKYNKANEPKEKTYAFL